MSQDLSPTSPKLPPEQQRPRHVAIIMDGNGRWAHDRGQPRIEGHRQGAHVVRDITTYARELGLNYLTLYSFSVQNWRRPPLEVAGLMQLLEEYCRDERATLMENNIRLGTVGRLDRLPESTLNALKQVVKETQANDGMVLTLAIDYGGREEIMGAVKQLMHDVEMGHLDRDDVDAEAFTARLMTGNLPDPDMVIRTSGEQRISNFLLWQIAYAELYYTPVAWPDFSRDDFASAISNYASRDRRFGATQEQVDSDAAEAPTDHPAGAAGPTSPKGSH